MNKEQEELRSFALERVKKAELIISITVEPEGSAVVIVGERELLLEALILRELSEDQSLLLSLMDIRKRLGDIIDIHLRVVKDENKMNVIRKLLDQ